MKKQQQPLNYTSKCFNFKLSFQPEIIQLVAPFHLLFLQRPEFFSGGILNT